MKNNVNKLSNAYKVAIKWVENNTQCNTYTLKWYEMSYDYITVLVETVNYIDNNNQIESEYFITINNDKTIKGFHGGIKNK